MMRSDGGADLPDLARRRHLEPGDDGFQRLQDYRIAVRFDGIEELGAPGQERYDVLRMLGEGGEVMDKGADRHVRLDVSVDQLW